MSEMVKRAALELKTGLGVALGASPAPGPRTPQSADDWTAEPGSGSIDLEALAKLTLLAALDVEDEALRRAIMGAPFHKPDTVDVTAIIQAIRRIAQGES